MDSAKDFKRYMIVLAVVLLGMFITDVRFFDVVKGVLVVGISMVVGLWISKQVIK